MDSVNCKLWLSTAQSSLVDFDMMFSLRSCFLKKQAGNHWSSFLEPEVGGMVDYNDPKYQTLVGIENEKVFTNKGGSYRSDSGQINILPYK